jgi:hypothetical protein
VKEENNFSAVSCEKRKKGEIIGAKRIKKKTK